MSHSSYKDKLFRSVLDGICKENDIPVEDKDLFVMLRGLNIMQMEIGPFADFNISREDQERLEISGETFDKILRDVDSKRENLIRHWEYLIVHYICECKAFENKSNQHRSWLNTLGKEYNKHPEWTVDMYGWALKFLEVARRKLIFDAITTSLSKCSDIG